MSSTLAILSIQTEFEGFFEANLTAKRASPAMLDTAKVWSRELDAVLKRRGREMLAAAVPNATQEEFEATHHWLHLQRPERVVFRMMEFFRSNRVQ